ncbi:iron-containing alcohol dehydrogenase [Aerococcus tenax]|uniref:iron-containing alcohol dehydrogenase n=1 Tax=Aerococcus tenax TaxID=3078812 RepID=UPI0018A6F693|nr:iron-containing alcohol dehydrogenase [Aerococcus tenax]
MVEFEYYNPAKIIFGEDSLKRLSDLLRENNVKSLLLIYSGDFIKDLGIYDVIQAVVRELDIRLIENKHVVPNPQIDLVRLLVEQGRSNHVDFILAVGGGSVIDTAKAVAIGIPYQGDVWDFYYKGISPEEVISIGVIATTASSGSETSNASIISNGEWKLGFEDNQIIPKFAIMNPRYTANLPLYQTAVGISDILAHLLERYFSDTENSNVTDYLIEGAINALLLNVNRLLKNLHDVNARAEIQWLASVAHNNYLDAERIADWGSHRIEHELSGQYNIVHGEGMAVVLLAWLRYAAERKPWRPALLATRVFHVDAHNYSESERTYILIQKLEALYKSLGLKTTLSELEIDNTQFETMSKRATRNGNVGHYISLDAISIQKILKLAL